MSAPAPQPASQPPQRPAYTGTGAWALGFLAYVPIPFLAQFVAGLIMAGVYPTHKARGPIARENARNAANWGLTYSILTVVFVGLALVFAFIASSSGADRSSAANALPFIPLALWAASGVVHVIVVIVGTVKASRGAVFRFPLAIRFIAP